MSRSSLHQIWVVLVAIVSGYFTGGLILGTCFFGMAFLADIETDYEPVPSWLWLSAIFPAAIVGISVAWLTRRSLSKRSPNHRMQLTGAARDGQ